MLGINNFDSPAVRSFLPFENHTITYISIKTANRGPKEGTCRVISSTELDLLLNFSHQKGTVVIVRLSFVERSRSEVKALGRGHE